jgi:hypothetical protein
LARSPFALQLQPLRLVVRPVQARAVQLAQVLARVRAVQLAQVLVPAQVVQLVLAVQQVLARALAKQAQQPHSPHQQLQSQCQPELCRLH